MKKTDLAHAVAATRRFAMKAIADTMGVARSHLVERMKPKTESARSQACLSHHVPEWTAARATYGQTTTTCSRKQGGDLALQLARVFRWL